MVINMETVVFGFLYITIKGRILKDGRWENYTFLETFSYTATFNKNKNRISLNE